MESTMRAWVLLTIVAVGCDGGVLTIGDDTPSTDDALVADTDAPDTDAPETDAPETDDALDDTGPFEPGDTDAASPFDSPRLAWDGRVAHTFISYLGPSANCSVTLTERGEEIAATAPLQAACRGCTRFFEVTVTHGANTCLQAWGDTEWRGLELRPTGAVAVTELFGTPGNLMARATRPNGVIQGTTLDYVFSESAFPLWKSERSRGRITLTPIP